MLAPLSKVKKVVAFFFFIISFSCGLSVSEGNKGVCACMVVFPSLFELQLWGLALACVPTSTGLWSHASLPVPSMTGQGRDVPFLFFQTFFHWVTDSRTSWAQLHFGLFLVTAFPLYWGTLPCALPAAELGYRYIEDT